MYDGPGLSGVCFLLRFGNEETLSVSVFCINEKTFAYDVQTQGHLETE